MSLDKEVSRLPVFKLYFYSCPRRERLLRLPLRKERTRSKTTEDLKKPNTVVMSSKMETDVYRKRNTDRREKDREYVCGQ